MLSGLDTCQIVRERETLPPVFCNEGRGGKFIFDPVAGALLYASTKGAVEALTKGLALELAPCQIRVNAIASGHTETEGNITAGTFDGGAGAVLAGEDTARRDLAAAHRESHQREVLQLGCVISL
jgi:NAD(P)-dependent dehydrogenase (short-subunit alcohol dehydrogenase family)